MSFLGHKSVPNCNIRSSNDHKVHIKTFNIHKQAIRIKGNVPNHDRERNVLSGNGYFVSSVILVVPIQRTKMSIYYSVSDTELKPKVTLCILVF